MDIYLAGAITNHPGDVREFRRKVANTNPYPEIDVIEPMDYEVEYDDVEKIIETDINLVSNSDGVLMYWSPEVTTYGSIVEIYHASWIEDKPVVIWLYDDKTTAPPPWLRGLVDEFSRSAVGAFEKLHSLIESA